MFNFFNANAGAFRPTQPTLQPPGGQMGGQMGGLMGYQPATPWWGQYNWMTGQPWQDAQGQSMAPTQEMPTMEQRVNHGGLLGGAQPKTGGGTNIGLLEALRMAMQQPGAGPGPGMMLDPRTGNSYVSTGDPLAGHGR